MKSLLKMEAVLGMIYMSIGVLVGLLHGQIYASERCIAGLVLIQDVLIEKAVVFRWSKVVWRHARQRRREWRKVMRLPGVIRIRCW